MSEANPNIYIYGYLYIIIILFGVTINFVMIATILYQKNLRNRLVNWFVVSLSVACFLSSCFIIPNYAYTLITGNSMPTIICKLVSFGNWFLNGASVLTIGAMALNRYFVIVWTKKTGLVSKEAVIIMITLCYVTPGILVIPGLSGATAQVAFDQEASRCTLIDKESKTFLMMLIMALGAGPIFFVIYCYCHIFWAVRKNRKQLVDINQAQKMEAARLRGEIRLAVIIGFIFVGYLVTYVPSVIANSIIRLESWHDGRQSTLLLVYSSVWINPLIYGMQNKPFRSTFSGIVCKHCKRQNAVSDIPVLKTPQNLS